MSFSPIPDALRTDLDRLGDASAVELGAGDGRYAAVMREAGAAVVSLDVSRASGGVDVLGDARRPPLRPGSVRLLVAANLLHHLWTARTGPALLARWQACVAPGGALHILEDEPGDDTPARRNHADLQDWLARCVPGRRPLLSMADFTSALAAAGAGSAWRFGIAVNATPPPAAAPLLAMLSGDGGVPDDATRELADRIRRHGLDYGRFWWARWSREELA